MMKYLRIPSLEKVIENIFVICLAVILGISRKEVNNYKQKI